MTSPSGSRCAVQVQAASTAFSPEGGQGTLQISTARECTWSAESGAAWLSLSPASGQGEGAVQLTVAANADPVTRSGSVGINDRRLEIVQAGIACELRVSSTHESVDATGGDRTVQVTANNAQCQWTATSAVPWITIVSGSAGSGNGAVTFRVTGIGDLPRTGTITVAGHAVRVEQGSGCSYSVGADAFSVSASGGSGQVSVSAPPDCTWSAESQSPWLTITSGGTGSGAGLVAFQAAASDGSARVGTLVVAGRLVTVSQSLACSYTVEPSAVVAPTTGGPGVVAVRTGPGCAWSASSTADWITITAGQGSGSGEVRFAVAPSGGAARSGSIRIGDAEVTISQDQSCSFTATPSAITAAAQATSGSIQITTAAGCAWSAASGAPWIAITGTASGAGPGQVPYSVEANTGPARQGSLTVAGQSVTVTQASGCAYALSPAVQSVSPIGGTGAIDVRTGAGCGWSAASTEAWLTVSPGSGAGPGQVQLSAAANSGPPRSATVSVAGQSTTVNQASPCSWSFAPPSMTLDAHGGTGTVLVIVVGLCTWTAESTAAWITITHGAAGTGNGMVQFQAAPNAGPARSGVLTIAGSAYTVTQRAP